MARRSPAVSSGLGPLLFECARLLDEIAQDEVNREAGARVLTPALVRLLPHLTVDGVRPTELARRVDVSKQAVGQALADLAGRGFVEQVPDPVDGRGRLVRLTREGVAAFDHGRGVLAFYEGELASRLGKAKIDALRSTLASLLPVLEGWTRDGAPQRPTPTSPARPGPRARARRRRPPNRPAR
ncbi:MAG: MarR family transcriptional regulator [Vicinamibacterales bacterium]